MRKEHSELRRKEKKDRRDIAHGKNERQREREKETLAIRMEKPSAEDPHKNTNHVRKIISIIKNK